MANQEVSNIQQDQSIQNTLPKADKSLKPILKNGYKYDLTAEETVKYLKSGLENKMSIIDNKMYYKNIEMRLENATKKEPQNQIDTIKLDAVVKIDNGSIELKGDTFSGFPEIKKI